LSFLAPHGDWWKNYAMKKKVIAPCIVRLYNIKQLRTNTKENIILKIENIFLAFNKHIKDKVNLKYLNLDFVKV